MYRPTLKQMYFIVTQKGAVWPKHGQKLFTCYGDPWAR